MEPTSEIQIRGAHEHNLKGVDVNIPKNRLTVITGVSGSGKSSLAFDTLYAEGYRKYMESLSARSRMFLSQIRRPEVDSVEGLTPVIAIAQHTSDGAQPRSTVATVTEVADYARLLWAGAGTPHCPLDGAVVKKQTIDDCIGRVFSLPADCKLILLAPVVEGPTAVIRETVEQLKLKGYARVRVDQEILEIDQPEVVRRRPGQILLEVVIDRVILRSDQRSRIADSLEIAFREGENQATVLFQSPGEETFNELKLGLNFSCSQCATTYPQPSPRLLNWSRPEGACPVCHGTGEERRFDSALVVPNPSLSLRKGAIKPWRLGSKKMIIRRNAMLKQLSEQVPFDPNLPWSDLPVEVQQLILHGHPEKQFSFKLRPGKAAPEVTVFAGVLEDLRQTFQNTTSEGLQARLSTYQKADTCSACGGRRLAPYPRSLLFQSLSICDFLQSTIGEAAAMIEGLAPETPDLLPWREAIQGLANRLRFLEETGLHYLTLDRPFGSLSGGEAQRVRLATQAGTGLSGLTYVLDEPSIGLHPRDIERLNHTLLNLRDRGSTVVVVEHEAATIRAADHLIEIGPGAGESGGQVVFTGPVEQSFASPSSISGPFLSGQRRIEHSGTVQHPDKGFLRVLGAEAHHLKSIDVQFAIGCLNVVCGVSGSGKSSLVSHILAKAAAVKLNRATQWPAKHRAIKGLEAFNSLVLVDQKPIGRSARSNPATFTKVFDELRKVFALTSLAKVRGYDPSRFSFNLPGGRCERCKGEGVLPLPMDFLSEATIPCTSCGGKRYNRETLEIRYRGKTIADVLEMTVEEAISFLSKHPKIIRVLQTLRDVGLGYLRLGQPATQLSGGEAQRLKLSLELSKSQTGANLYILDEPTTGLHWIDIERLFEVLVRLRNAGNTIIIIEHDLDLIRLSDWLVELGPEGGPLGGYLLYEGPTGSWITSPEDTPTLTAYRQAFGQATGQKPKPSSPKTTKPRSPRQRK
ncbi:MAG: excinuclease ABC subunit UvrA [Puniceicoccaceae bacterium]